MDAWLGNEFDENREFETDFRFEHDIPLQRSISLDRGIEIFDYLQSIESYSSESVTASYWSISSGEVELNLRLERDRSFEDIPASHLRAKSRHISLDVTNSMMGNSLALSVLRESYKGIDEETGIVTPKIKKLKMTYSKIFEDHREFTKSSAEHLVRAATEVDMSELKCRVPMCSSVSLDVEDNDIRRQYKTEDVLDDKKLRQRRFGVTTNVWQKNSTTNMSQEAMIGQKLSEYKSCDDVFVKSRVRSRLGSVEAINEPAPFVDLKESYKKAKYSVEYSSNQTIQERNMLSLTSNISKIDSPDLIEVDKNCDCRTCSEKVDDHRKSFLSRNLHKIFMRIVSYKEYGRSLVCGDENNNVNENQMYACVIHVLKLLLGLWLRHFDHKQPTICC